MTLETYWTVVAPGALFGLSLIGWIALLLTRHPRRLGPHDQSLRSQPLVAGFLAMLIGWVIGKRTE